MKKQILKKIVQDWASEILIACDVTSNDGELTDEEMNYVLSEVNKIAFRISKTNLLLYIA